MALPGRREHRSLLSQNPTALIARVFLGGKKLLLVGSSCDSVRRVKANKKPVRGGRHASTPRAGTLGEEALSLSSALATQGPGGPLMAHESGLLIAVRLRPAERDLLDALVSGGFGENRSQVIRRLIRDHEGVK